MDKNEKELEKERKNKEKQDGIDKECDAAFATKMSSGSSGSPVDQLKVWLDNTPFKSNNSAMKRDTFIAIITAVMALKQADIDAICGQGGSLNDKMALTLCKYLFKAFEFIGQNDKCKYNQRVNSVL